MRLLRTFPLLAFALVLLAVVGFCVAQESVGLLLVCGALAAMSWYVTEGPRGRSLPRWTSNVLVIAVTINLIADFFQNPESLLGVLGRFVIWLTLIKLYERKAARDYAQLLSLSLLLILIGATGRANIIFGGILAIYGLLGVYVLLAYQLYASYEVVRGARRDAIGEHRPVLPSLRPIIGRRPGMHFRSLVTGIVISGFVGSAALFVLFPRGMGGWIGSIAPDGPITSGIPDDVNLTTGTRINESRRVVLTARFFDHNGMTIGNERAIRLRSDVREDYDERGAWLRADSALVRPIELSTPGFAGLGEHAITPDFDHTLEIDVFHVPEWLFTTGTPIAVSTPEAGAVVRFDPRRFTLMAASGRAPQRYTIRFQSAPSDETLQALTGNMRPRIYPSPSDGRYADLARQILRSAGLPEAQPQDAAERWNWHRDASQALADHLRRGAYTYTLDLRDVTLPISNGRPADPTAHFLFETRRGHCEYFASGLILMCRSIGIPARMVIGYLAMEFDDSDKQFIVRDSNAHAWVEVQTGPRRWREVDPTPASIIQAHAGTGSFADQARFLFDRAEATWENGFWSFDHDAQLGFAHQLDLSTSWFSDAWGGIRDWLSAVNRRFYFGPAGYIWMLGVGAIGIVTITVAWRVFRRWGRIRSTVHLEHFHGVQSQRLLRQLGFYLDMLRVLERGSCAKPYWQPPLAFAGTLARTKPTAAETVRELTTMFYEARYGGRRLTTEDLKEAQTLIGGLDESL